MKREDGKSVTRNAAWVGGLTGVSRILGLLRESLTANMFGTSTVQSAFVVAFQIPNLFRRLFGEGALSAAFVPAFTTSVASDSVERAKEFGRKFITAIFSILAAFCAALILASYAIEPFLAPGSRWAEILPLMRIMLPYAIFICMAAATMGMLNVLKDFKTPAISPAILNVVWILALVALCPMLRDDERVRITAVAWCVMLAGLLQFAYQWDALRRRGFRLRFQRGAAKDSRIREVVLKALPAMVGLGVVQINVCIDHLLAMTAATWAPSALQYAERVIYLPMGVIATAFSTVLLATFSAQYESRDFEGMKRVFRNSLEDMMLVIVPAMIGIIALATPIVSVLFEHGQFTPQDTVRASRALICYAPGLLFFTLQKTLNPIFYAMKDVKTPTVVSCCVVALNLALNVTFIILLPSEWKHCGIAASTVLCSVIGSAILASIASRRIGSLAITECAGVTGRCLIGAIPMGVAAWLVVSRLSPYLRSMNAADTIAGVFSIAVAMLVSIIVYFGILRIIAPSDIRRIFKRLRHRR